LVNAIGSLGATSSYWMVAETVAANLSGATELWTSATGCLEFSVSIFDGMTGGTDWAVAVWDDATDATALKAVAANVIATGPAGTADGSACVNTAGICQPSQSIRVVSPDGTRIKAIAVVGNAAHKYLLTVVA
jgi:hypothetical protein